MNKIVYIFLFGLFSLMIFNSSTFAAEGAVKVKGFGVPPTNCIIPKTYSYQAAKLNAYYILSTKELEVVNDSINVPYEFNSALVSTMSISGGISSTHKVCEYIIQHAKITSVTYDQSYNCELTMEISQKDFQTAITMHKEMYGL